MSEREPAAATDVARRAYEDWHDRLEVDADADTPWHRLVRRHLVWDRDVRGKRVLELACGRGGFACWMAAQSPPPDVLVAADFAASAIGKAREHAEARQLAHVRFERQDVQKIEAPTGSFDTVISCETIEHVPEPWTAVAELARVLRPGGRLFLTTPNYLGVMGVYRGYLRLTGRRYTEEGQPINRFMLLPSVVSAVRGAGLRVRVVDGVGHYLPVPGRPPVRLDGLDRARWVTKWLALHSLVVAEKR